MLASMFEGRASPFIHHKSTKTLDIHKCAVDNVAKHTIAEDTTGTVCINTSRSCWTMRE